jgi:hypothetical protein
MTTNVPEPTFGVTGFIAPAESAVLAGTQADINTAFGGTLNSGLTTPQGQLASSEAAIIGDKNDQFLALSNGVDPAYAAGRMQDAIGRIYFIDRNAAQATVLQIACGGLANTPIPVNAQIQDDAGNIYNSTVAGTIPTSGTITISFACQATGPIAIPASISIYQTISGWDTAAVSSGVIGNDVETRADFEYRRQNSVAANAQGSRQAVLGAVLGVSGVLDAYVIENPLPVTSGAVVTGTISGNILTVTAADSRYIGSGEVGALRAGQMVAGTGVVQGTLISAFGTGAGGVGTYTVDVSQTVASETLTCAIGGVPLVPNSLYVAAYGGEAQAIANAIQTKKSPGCNTQGNTTCTVVDTNYSAPQPSYPISLEVPPPTAPVVLVTMAQNSQVPSNAALLIQTAVLNAFTGADGGTRARIASTLYASRFNSGVAALGTWAQIVLIQIGFTTANQNFITFRANQIPTLSASNISVVFQ